MKSGYTFHTNPKNVSISNPIPNREAEMVQNLAGGYAFKAEDFVALRRWLLTGSENNAFYQARGEMTSLNVAILKEATVADPVKVAEEIVYASDHGLNNHTPILALVYLSIGNDIAKSQFKMIFNKVIRTASHLYEFMEYTKGLRGFGKVIHTVIENWIKAKELKNLEYQFLKYQSREGWSARDVLRKVKPIPRDMNESNLFAWIAGKTFTSEALPLIEIYESLKKGTYKENDVIKLIIDYNLTHEMIPANIERTKGIWEALFQKMPITATLRNLANLTNKGIFGNIENLKILETKFSKDILLRGRVHPISVVSAYKIYSAGGTLGRSQLTWKSVPMVEDILEKAIMDAYDVLEPTGKFFLHAVDVSGSMGSPVLENIWMTPREIASIMALATIKSEKYYEILAVSKPAIPFKGLTKSTSFRDILTGRHLQEIPREYVGSLTNLGSVISYATANKIKADVIVTWTDGQSWVGDHPSILLKEYRSRVNPDVKMVYAILVPYGDRISLTDPRDTKSYDLGGFSTETTKFIQLIANGEL